MFPFLEVSENPDAKLLAYRLSENPCNGFCPDVISFFCGEKGIPAIFSSAPTMGSTAPNSIAGSVAQARAEFFWVLVLAQFKNPGAPVIGRRAAQGLLELLENLDSLEDLPHDRQAKVGPKSPAVLTRSLTSWNIG